MKKKGLNIIFLFFAAFWALFSLLILLEVVQVNPDGERNIYYIVQSFISVVCSGWLFLYILQWMTKHK